MMKYQNVNKIRSDLRDLWLLCQEGPLGQGKFALFSTQGPRASYPHSYRCHFQIDNSLDSEYFLCINISSRCHWERGERGRGGGENTTYYTFKFSRRRFLRLFKYSGREGLNFSSFSAFQGSTKYLLPGLLSLPAVLGQLPGDQLAGGGHQVLLAGLLLELHLEQVAEVLLGGELEAGLHVGGLFMTFLPDETCAETNMWLRKHDKNL